MELKFYRIDRSVMGRIGHFFKKPDLPLNIAAGAMPGGILGHAFRVFSDVTTDNCYILSDDDEISRFRNPLNEELLDDVYYIRHPKQICTNLLIPATRFHAYIIREQISDIVSYVRANTRVKRLRVSISNGTNAKFGAGGLIKDIPVEGDAQVRFARNHEVIIECSKPLRASQKRLDYIWMNDFASTREAIDNVTSGTVTVLEECDFSLGLNAKVAEMIGVSAEFMKSYQYQIQCELA
jgi:hypothetical protein